jgi:hypothetical protein
MLEELPTEMATCVGYRIAYGEAARLAEMATFDHGWGRDFATGIGGEADAIEKLRRGGASTWRPIHPNGKSPSQTDRSYSGCLILTLRSAGK